MGLYALDRASRKVGAHPFPAWGSRRRGKAASGIIAGRLVLDWREQYANVITRSHNRGANLRASDVYPEILTRLRHHSDLDVVRYDPIRIGCDFAIEPLRPAFKDHSLVELFSLRLVHVLHHDARFRVVGRGEMFLNKRLAGNRKSVCKSNLQQHSILVWNFYKNVCRINEGYPSTEG